MPDHLDEAVLAGVAHDRRTFVKRLVAGTAFAIPVVSSFDMHGLRMSSVTAQIPNSTFASFAIYELVEPVRICDTRTGSGLPFAGQTLGPGDTLTINAQFPIVKINVTVTNPTAPGYLQIKAAGSSYSGSLNTSVINFAAGQTVANEITVATNASGDFEIKKNATGSTDVVVDLVGGYNLLL